MAILNLPAPGVDDFEVIYRIELDGTFFRFQFRWNPRDNSWYLDIGGDDGLAVVRNIRMVIAGGITDPYKALAIPQGDMSVVDTTETGVEAERIEFGDRIQLRYTEVET